MTCSKTTGEVAAVTCLARRQGDSSSRACPVFVRTVIAILLVTVELTLASQSFAQDELRERLDPSRLKAAGIRQLEGQHITLLTDVVDRADVADMATVFDQAVPQWCQHFDIDPKTAGSWKVVACVMLDQDRFQRAGLFPGDLPPFPAGYQRGRSLWLFVTEGSYYTRHLLLHEGTHAFMQEFLGGFGPPWYAEGMAEWLALHRWSEGKLQLKHHVRNKAEVPYWGRVKILREDRQQQQALTLDQVLQTETSAFRQVRSYAWAWAACELLGKHPEFKDAFSRLKDSVTKPVAEFNRELIGGLGPTNWSKAKEQFQLMIGEIEFGYDVERAMLIDVTARTEQNQQLVVGVTADRGWQDTGIHVQPGQIYQLSASGNFLIKRDSQDWNCQPGGVTIEYYRGLPLGRLIAAVGGPDNVTSDGYRVHDVGLDAQIRFEQAGPLLLRINESPSQWGDNQGRLEVRIKAVTK